jgi:hypothetical protein
MGNVLDETASTTQFQCITIIGYNKKFIFKAYMGKSSNYCPDIENTDKS